jgi:hypothetical protein
MTGRVCTTRCWRSAVVALATALAAALAVACGDRPAVHQEPSTQAARTATPEPTRVAAPQDSATILYRVARQALGRGDSAMAVQGFDQVFLRWPQSDRAPHALYWKAFVMYRRGGAENLQVAHRLLDLATQMAPTSYAVGDAATLLLRVRHRLASAGDRDALRELGLPNAATLAACGDAADANRLVWAVDPGQPMAARLTRLRILMEERGPCSAPLREQALLLLARVPAGAGVPDILGAARNDSALAVRRSAIRAIPRPAPDSARALLEHVLGTGSDLTSLEAAAAAWASRPDWGMEPLRAFLRRADRNATAADYIESLLKR